MGSNIVINTRVLCNSTTGLQRYLRELLSRFPATFRTLAPQRPLGMLKSHAWEQTVLPRQKEKHEILFSPCNTGPVFLSKQVVTIHDVVPIDRPEWFSKGKAALYRFVTPRLVRRAARLITISEYSKQRLIECLGADEQRISVIPNGVDARFARQTNMDVLQMRSRLNLPAGRYVLSIGTLEPRKNLPRLLLAWSKIVGQVPDDVCLVLAGKHDATALLAQCPSLSALPARVFMMGHVPDELLPTLYAGALAFVFPSLYEGFGLPPLEAMACGVPVLAGHVTSLPEVIGDAGLLVDPYRTEKIADGLLALIENDALRNKLVIKGLERARQFSWEETARNTWTVLQEAASE